MSSWYLFAAMGFYPVNPASAEFMIGAPMFSKFAMKLGSGKTFTVNAKNSGGTTSSVALGFVLGSLIGAGLALLLAPGTGRETRRRLAEAGERWSDAARKEIDHAGEIALGIAMAVWGTLSPAIRAAPAIDEL